jgi:hypothetical protein
MTDEEKRVLNELSLDPNFSKMTGYIEAMADMEAIVKLLTQSDSTHISPFTLSSMINEKVIAVSLALTEMYPELKNIIGNIVTFGNRDN